ncbi:MAG: acetyl-CoA acetyltransferase [Pseudomonadota bacterium]
MTKTSPNTPVLVGIGTAMQKHDDPAQSLEASMLMALAAQRAGEDCGQPELLTRCDSILVPKGTWNYSDPARLIADEINATGAKTVLANIGVLQQTIITRACETILNGEQEFALVCGGETKYRAMRASRLGIDPNDTMQTDIEPDEFLTISDDIISPVEMERGMAMPVTPYAMMESAMRYADGDSIEKNRQDLGSLYATFSEIASNNPDAWIRDRFTAEEIAFESERNRMLAFPYTKRMNTQWNVDQSAALLFCSLSKAQELGLDPAKFVFPLAATESDHMTLVSERAELHRCHGAAIAGKRVAELAEVSLSSIDLLDLYSCFPAAVKAYSRELGIGKERSLVVGGSMAFAGGPLNNFVLQSTATMGRLLRKEPQKIGLVSAVSGMLTKQGFCVWSATPNRTGFQYDDVSDATARAVLTTPLNADYAGRARVAGYTVNSIPGFPDSLVAICDTAGGERAIATSDNTVFIKKVCKEELCGRDVLVSDGSELHIE